MPKSSFARLRQLRRGPTRRRRPRATIPARRRPSENLCDAGAQCLPFELGSAPLTRARTATVSGRASIRRGRPGRSLRSRERLARARRLRHARANDHDPRADTARRDSVPSAVTRLHRRRPRHGRPPRVQAFEPARSDSNSPRAVVASSRWSLAARSNLSPRAGGDADASDCVVSSSLRLLRWASTAAQEPARPLDRALHQIGNPSIPLRAPSNSA